MVKRAKERSFDLPVILLLSKLWSKNDLTRTTRTFVSYHPLARTATSISCLRYVGTIQLLVNDWTDGMLRANEIRLYTPSRSFESITDVLVYRRWIFRLLDVLIVSKNFPGNIEKCVLRYRERLVSRDKMDAVERSCVCSVPSSRYRYVRVVSPAQCSTALCYIVV